jgi:hypothetical protein
MTDTEKLPAGMSQAGGGALCSEITKFLIVFGIRITLLDVLYRCMRT